MNPVTDPTPIDHTQKEHNIRELQEKLRALSYSDSSLPRPAVTGIRDSMTDDALRKFQQKTGLSENGIADLATWRALDTAYLQLLHRYTPSSPLYPVRGDAFFSMPHPPAFVLLLQILLMTLSQATDAVPPVSLTGAYDDRTAQAISAVQSLAGIPPTGRLDAPTWDTITALYNLEAAKFISSPPIRPPAEAMGQ